MSVETDQASLAVVQFTIDDVTVNEAAGTLGFNLVAWVGVFAPRAVPAETVARLSGEIAKIVAEADVQARFRALGLDAVSTTSVELREIAKQDRVRFADVVKTSGIKAE